MTAMIQALISPFRASFTYVCQFVHPTTERNKKLYHIIDSFVLQMNANFRGKKLRNMVSTRCKGFVTGHSDRLWEILVALNIHRVSFKRNL